jgi:hypothetical protein
MKYSILTFGFLLLFGEGLKAQASFKTVRGTKANYTISIPSDYQPKSAIGANVDLKYANTEGAGIIVVILKLEAGTKSDDVVIMNSTTDSQFVEQLEARGLMNVRVIKRGFIDINGIKSYYAYYRDDEIYYHTITQFIQGKLLNLTYSCLYPQRDLYMPYMFRVMNSIKS